MPTAHPPVAAWRGRALCPGTGFLWSEFLPWSSAAAGSPSLEVFWSLTTGSLQPDGSQGWCFGSAKGQEQLAVSYEDVVRKTPSLVQPLLKTRVLHCGQSHPLGCLPGLPRASPGRSGRGGGSTVRDHMCVLLACSGSLEKAFLRLCVPAAPELLALRHPLGSPPSCTLWWELCSFLLSWWSVHAGLLSFVWEFRAQNIHKSSFCRVDLFLPGKFCQPLPFPGSSVLVCARSRWLRCDSFVSPCQKGVFRLMNEDYFIEPVSTSFREDGAAQPHRVYKRQAPEHGAERGRRPPAPRETCGVRGMVPFLLQFCSELVAPGSRDAHEAHHKQIKGAEPSLSPGCCFCRLVSLKPGHSAPVLSSQHPSMTPVALRLSFASWAGGPSCRVGWREGEPSEQKAEWAAGRGQPAHSGSAPWPQGCPRNCSHKCFYYEKAL